MLKFPGNIPVSIYPFFWIMAFLIGWLSSGGNIPQTVIWAAVIVVSIIVHEFGHALTAVAFGQRAQIELVGFGGVTQRTGGGKLKLWQEFVIVLNGPLAGFCLAGLSWWAFGVLKVAQPESFVTYATQIAFLVNFYWTILNLLPVQPLDGGKLFSIILQSILGVKGIKIALFISMFLAAALGIFFFTTRQFFIGSLFMLFTFESYKSWKESLSITEEDQNSLLQNILKDGENQFRSGNTEEALQNFQKIRESTNAGVIYQTATENAAHILADRGDLKEAFEMVSSLGKKVTPDALFLLHQLAFSQKKWEKVVALGDSVFQSYPSYKVGVANAASHAMLGNVKPAIGWLQCAIQEDLPHVDLVIARSEFDGIRNDPQFRQFISKQGVKS